MSCSECSRDYAIICSMLCRSTSGDHDGMRPDLAVIDGQACRQCRCSDKPSLPIRDRIEGLDGLRRRAGVELHRPPGAMDARRAPRRRLLLFQRREQAGTNWNMFPFVASDQPETRIYLLIAAWA